MGLLFELPLNGLPSHVLNLRQTLLSSLTKRSTEEESYIITSTKDEVAARIPDIFPRFQYRSYTSQQLENLTQLSQTVKSDVARWIRQAVLMRVPLDDTGTDSENEQLQKSGSSAYSIMSFDTFLRLRRIVEDIGDFNILADILDLLADRVHGLTLTAIADTINTYFDTFSAVGAAANLFQKLCKTVEIGSTREIESTFLESLLDLGCRLPKADREIQRLRKALKAQTTKFPAAACSPISDTMVEAVQSNEPSFASEMDQILASGTSMDKKTLTRVFGTLIGHLEKSFEDSGHLVVRFSNLLATLRGFGSSVFDTLLAQWLHDWLQTNGSRNRVISLVPLICSQAVSLGVVLQAVIRVPEAKSGGSHMADTALEVLKLITGYRLGSTFASEYRGYRLSSQLHETIQTAPTTLIAVMHWAVKACQASDYSTCIKDMVRDLALSILLWHSEGTVSAAIGPSQYSLNSDMQDAIGNTLYQAEFGGSPQSYDSNNIMRILNDISDFNISLYRLKLRAAFVSIASSSQGLSSNLSRVIIERVTTSTEHYGNLWTCLISDLPVSQASSLRDLSESEVLAWAMNDTSSVSNVRARQISSLVSIVEASAPCIPTTEALPHIERIVEILPKEVQSFELESRHCQPGRDCDFFIRRTDALLRLLVVHQSAMQDPKYPQNIFHQLLIALSLLLINPLLASNPSLSHRIFDLLSLLTDSISDDTRLRCIHSLRDNHRIQDSRLRFVFGYTDSVESEWLQLVSRTPSAAETRSGGAVSTASKTYEIRRWEMMQDATPVATDNDTSLSLTLFGSRKSVL